MWQKKYFLFFLLFLGNRGVYSYQRLFEYQIDHFQQGILKRQAQLQSTMTPNDLFRYFYLIDPQVQVRLIGSKLCPNREQQGQNHYCLSRSLKGSNLP